MEGLPVRALGGEVLTDRELRRASLEELVAGVASLTRAANRIGGAQARLLAEIARRDEAPRGDGTMADGRRGPGHVSIDSGALVSEALGVSAAVAEARVASAAMVCADLPSVMRAMDAGDVDPYRAQVVASELADCAPAARGAVDRELGPFLAPRVTRTGRQVGVEGAGALRRRVRAIISRVDEESLTQRIARARARRGVHRWAGEPGLDTWTWTVPAADSAACYRAVDTLARRLRAAGEAETLDQARSDALTRLVLRSATVTTTLVVHTTADAALSGRAGERSRETRAGDPSRETRAGDPSRETRADGRSRSVPSAGERRRGEPAGRRVGVATAVHERLASLPDDALLTLGGPSGTVLHVPASWLRERVAAPGSRIRELPVDPTTGALRPEAESSSGYVPAERLRFQVLARDGGCRFPECTVGPHHCDLDHVRPFPLGPTRASNLIALCRRHHRLKHTGRWRPQLHADGSVTWTDPLGTVRTTLPVDQRLVGVLPEGREAATTPREQPAEPPAEPLPGARGARGAEPVLTRDDEPVFSSLEHSLEHLLLHHRGMHPRGMRPDEMRPHGMSPRGLHPRAQVVYAGQWHLTEDPPPF